MAWSFHLPAPRVASPLHILGASANITTVCGASSFKRRLGVQAQSLTLCVFISYTFLKSWFLIYLVIKSIILSISCFLFLHDDSQKLRLTYL